MLGELNWVFTAITDTIAWNTLPRGKRLYIHVYLFVNAKPKDEVIVKILLSYRSVPKIIQTRPISC